jgi:hypothetical protein
MVLIGAVILCNFTEDISYRTLKTAYKTIIDRGETEIKFDEQGVPYVDYGYDDGVFIGQQRNPVTVSQRGLIYIENYKNGDTSSRQLFINCADWLQKNSVKYDGYSTLEYNFPWPKYNMTAPWRSAMAQSQAIQLLVQAYKQTKNQEYLSEAKNLLNTFFIESFCGGVTIKTQEKGWWYEEYADENGVRSMVLNGMMFSILGIYEYYQYTMDKDAKYIFDQGILALEYYLPRYDNNGDSYYDIINTPSGTYHDTHIWQLDALYYITGNDVFKEYHNRWQSFDNNYFLIKLILNPIPTRLMILFMNFMVLLVILETIPYVHSKSGVIIRKTVIRSGKRYRQTKSNLFYYNRST